MVSPINGKEEFWIPASLVPNSSVSRAWSFRPRRIDSEGESAHFPRDACIAMRNSPPAISTVASSVRATVGGVARLVLEMRCAEDATVTWRKEGQRRAIEGTDRFRCHRTANVLCLEIAPCRFSDAGIYRCCIQHETASCTARIPLRVFDGNDDGNQSGNQDGAAVHRTDTREASSRTSEEPTARFDARNTSNEDKTLPILTEDVVSWEAEQFVGRYLELEELGSGRFARVRRARDRGTGQEVALKQISRARQSRLTSRAEYDLLRSTRHGNIIRAFALFENAPRPGVDTIVLELVEGSTLLAFLSEKQEYTEATIAKYAGELLSALRWLHSRERAHLDLKPENVLVDRKTGIAKLIDLGEAVKAAPLDEVVPPADLEFAAPESVLGRPSGPYTDMWAAGVFFYVLLSGLSPFLDDSIEETTANILKCDFCFPEEYFGGISNEAKDLLGRMLRLRGEERANADVALSSSWFEISTGATIPSSRMAAFIERRAHRCSKSLQNRNAAFPRSS